MLFANQREYRGSPYSCPQCHLLSAKATEAYDVVVVGAGFAGMYMLHRLRGQGMTARVFEQGWDVGGTWY